MSPVVRSKLGFDFPFLVHVVLIIKDDNHQNCRYNNLAVSPCDMLTHLTSKWTGTQRQQCIFFLSNHRCESDRKLSVLPVIVIKCSNSFIKRGSIVREVSTFLYKLRVICFYGITLFLCIISTWPRLLFSSLFATSVTVSCAALNTLLPSCTQKCSTSQRP